MNQEGKRFEMPEIIILLMLAVANDVITILADLVLLIPLIGLFLFGIVTVLNAVIWGFILLWFIMKLGFAGKVGILQVGGGIGQFIGIPSRTLTVGIGIFLTNHPKVAGAAMKVAEVGTAVAATAATAGAAAPAAVAAAGGTAATATAGVGATAVEAGTAAAEAGMVGMEATGAAAAGGRAAGAVAEGVAPGAGVTPGPGGLSEGGAAPAGGGVSERELGAREGFGEVRELTELQERMTELPEPAQKKEEEEDNDRTAGAGRGGARVVNMSAWKQSHSGGGTVEVSDNDVDLRKQEKLAA